MTGWVRLMAGYALGAWMPAFYIRMHGLSPATIATWMSLILLVGGITGSFIGGAVADWWVKVRPSVRTGRMAVVTLLD